MKINQTGIELIKRFEGCKLEPYVCPAGKITIGIGHVILHSDNITGPITEQRAEELLRHDCEIAEKTIDKYVLPVVQLSSNQYSALVSFIFNLGAGAFKSSTLAKMLRQKDIDGAAAEFDKWNKARQNGRLVALDGLTKRRAAERQLFVTPDRIDTEIEDTPGTTTALAAQS